MSNEDTKTYLRLQVSALVTSALNLPVTRIDRFRDELHIVVAMTGEHADAPLYKAIREQFAAEPVPEPVPAPELVPDPEVPGDNGKATV